MDKGLGRGASALVGTEGEGGYFDKQIGCVVGMGGRVKGNTALCSYLGPYLSQNKCSKAEYHCCLTLFL